MEENNTMNAEEQTSKNEGLNTHGVFPVKGGLLKLPIVNNTPVGFGVLAGAFVIGLLIASIAMLVLMKYMGLTQRAMQITALIQDILAFIIPALAAAFAVTRLPAAQLSLNVKPRLDLLIVAMIVLVVSTPAMGYIVALNQNLPLPESIATVLRGMEDQAAAAVSNLAGGKTIPDLILGILVLGLLTGLAEELFFRGGMQNLMFTTRLNKHIAVWLTAFIFSAMHFQFYGFVPRLLLGAYFGYLIWWTGSIWIPVLCHALNNSLAVIAQYTEINSLDPTEADYSLSQFGASDYAMMAGSVVLTAVGLYLLYRRTRPAKQSASAE